MLLYWNSIFSQGIFVYRNWSKATYNMEGLYAYNRSHTQENKNCFSLKKKSLICVTFPKFDEQSNHFFKSNEHILPLLTSAYQCILSSVNFCPSQDLWVSCSLFLKCIFLGCSHCWLSLSFRVQLKYHLPSKSCVKYIVSDGFSPRTCFIIS